MSPWLASGVLLLFACHHGAGRPDPEPCAPTTELSETLGPADSLAGRYRLQLTSDSGAAAAVEGALALRPADPSSPSRTRGIPDTTHRYPLVGTLEIDLAAVGAVAPGGTTNNDPAAPGVLVIERTGGRSSGERILLRLGAQANQADQVRFDGGYTVLRVRQIDGRGFRGVWESGAPLPRAHGQFCASRVKALR